MWFADNCIIFKLGIDCGRNIDNEIILNISEFILEKETRVIIF